MKILKTLLVILLILVAIPLLTALFLPTDYEVMTTINIEKPKEDVYSYLSYVKNQNKFGPWAKMDPDMKQTFTGIDGTLGFVSRWESDHPHVGIGEQEITGLHPGERIDFALRFETPNEAFATAYFTTEAIDSTQTKVVWGCAGTIDYPWNILLLTGMQKEMEQQFQEGLQNLKKTLDD